MKVNMKNMKNYVKIVTLGAIACLAIGCSSGTTEDDSKVNSDVATGTPPPQLEGSTNANGGGGAETPNSTPD